MRNTYWHPEARIRRAPSTLPWGLPADFLGRFAPQTALAGGRLGMRVTAVSDETYSAYRLVVVVLILVLVVVLVVDMHIVFRVACGRWLLVRHVDFERTWGRLED